MSNIPQTRTHKPKILKLTVEEYDEELTPKERGNARAIAHEMGKEYAKTVRSYQKILNLTPPDEPLRERLTAAYIHEQALGSNIPELIAQLHKKPMPDIGWSDFQNAAAASGEDALKLWQTMLDAASDHNTAGAFAAEAIGFSIPWRRAQFSAVRDSFNTEWKPRGGIESALIDMLVQSYFGYLHWLDVSFTIARYEHTMIEERAESGEEWRPPRQSHAELLEHATQMADRFNRMFLRVLRQMRDLRRYNLPVMINNPRQVNIAADGGQQVNVQEKGKPDKKVRPPEATNHDH